MNQDDITFMGATALPSSGGPSEVIPEGMALTNDGAFYICSGGSTSPENSSDPSVQELGGDGQHRRNLPVSERFKPAFEERAQIRGVRPDLGLKSLTVTPDGRRLYTATENALIQDGPAASLEDESLCRIIEYDLASGRAVREIVYIADSIAEESDAADGSGRSGLVELLATDNNGTFLALERSFSMGRGYSVKIYEARSQGALDVIGEDDLFREEEVEDGDETIPPGPYEIDPPVAKRLLLDLGELGLTLENIEGMTFGPRLEDGRRTLLLVSDNDFDPSRSTQFLAFAVELKTIPAAVPTLETPTFIQEDDFPLPAGARLGDADDPAIWVHPTDPSQSLVIGTLKEGGLVVFNLNGQVLQAILPGEFGDVLYNNVDLIYNFQLGDRRIDLAVASDQENDTLAIFAIDPATCQLTDVTADSIPDTIFGIDDGDLAALGLTAYRSPVSGKSYVFVSQNDESRVAQLELMDDGDGKVTARIVRVIELPVPTDDPADSVAEGMVADRELGYLYVAMEEEIGLLKFDAEPDGGNDFEIIHSIDSRFFEPQIEGLAIYYGPNGTGYLIASSQGDSTYAVFRREGDNEYLGSFVVGDILGIDQANETDGLDLINVSLGLRFPFGLLVVQDGANDPQFVVPDDEELENQSTNFKFVSWADVAAALGLVIDTDSSHPRR